MARDAAGPGRPRSDASHEAILKATLEILLESGFGKLSIEGVAARAKVGKTSIYRWWPSKGALAVDAFVAVVSPTVSLPTASARLDLEVHLRKLARAYRGETGRLVREMIGSGLMDPDAMKRFDEAYLEPRRAAARAVLHRGVASGELRDDLDIDVIVDAIYAPIFQRLLVGHASIDDAFVTMLLDVVLSGLAKKAV